MLTIRTDAHGVEWYTYGGLVVQFVPSCVEVITPSRSVVLPEMYDVCRLPNPAMAELFTHACTGVSVVVPCPSLSEWEEEWTPVAVKPRGTGVWRPIVSGSLTDGAASGIVSAGR